MCSNYLPRENFTQVIAPFEAKGIADSQKTISQGLTPQILQLRAIEATEKFSQSPNSKVVIVRGGGQEGLPVMLQLDNASSN